MPVQVAPGLEQQKDLGLDLSYPDGAPIAFFITDLGNGEVELSDGGETTRRLRVQAGCTRLPKRLAFTVEGICRMNDVEHDRGTLVVRSPKGKAHERVAAIKLAKVCRRIAQL